MIAVVTGGRDYTPTREDLRDLGLLCFRMKVAVVRHGGCRGVDLTVAKFFDGPHVKTEAWPADWDAHGRAAGPRRNREMLAGADVLFAFRGGRGTADCCRAAGDLGVLVLHIGAAS